MALSHRFEVARVASLRSKIESLLETQKQLETEKLQQEKEILLLRETITHLNQVIEGRLYNAV